MRFLSTLTTVVLAVTVAHAQQRDEWKQHVPAADKVRENAMAHTPDATAAGARIYEDHCSGCHGAEGQGHRTKPAITGTDTTQATDGELFWLLRNGVISKGMPAWTTLPDAQRWQLISFVRSLDITHKPAQSAGPNSPQEKQK